jgi:Cu-Zn family superoxide dismutase
MKAQRNLHLLLALFLLAACGGQDLDGPVDTADESAPMTEAEASLQDDVAARAVLRNRLNEEVGSAELTETAGSVRLAVEIADLQPGEHGFHIHETGSCDAPDFESAGGHFNPTDEEHGIMDPEGSHVGDMANLVVSQDGTAEAARTIDRANLGDGPRSLLRSGGTAIMIHARPDDYETDPSGAAGARIACGVIEAT